MTQSPPPQDPPQIGIRLVVAHDDVTRRVDLQLVGSRGVAVEDGLVTTFEASRLWPTVRAVLPELAHLRADPHGLPSPDPDRRPGEGWDRECRAMVSVAVASLPGGEVALRTWFATDDELWSATPLPDGRTDLRLAAPGAVADLLIWDVTGAMEVLVAAAEVAS
ncbi:hypothetical protein G5V58_20930 [Nocardioides anomalus]|uniref:Uncharacterized protein n=1 Tax=Nocardioides anomalus TaxID=2712223 RepID=A0A6G6WI64_9ACTN|nr:hypothetical protein [Nocardioides anomalus]QIG44909.1 hypothetical protein G5V58_20930 [Nocardioides anomalus]